MLFLVLNVFGIVFMGGLTAGGGFFLAHDHDKCVVVNVNDPCLGFFVKYLQQSKPNLCICEMK